MDVQIYIHVPYCIKKCRYCGFKSIENSFPPEGEYVRAVLDEAGIIKKSGSRKDRISTIYIGGGTPTLFSPGAIGRLIEGLDRLWGIEASVEISIEANPETINKNISHGLKAAGINRISLGAQSFSDRLLGVLGRVHNSKKSFFAYDCLRAASFENINLDIIYAIPGQKMTDLVFDLKSLGELCPEHASFYMFSPDTEWAKELEPLSDEITEKFFFMVIDGLNHIGFVHYEISNFSKPGYECRHNLGYWGYKPYIGLGAAAVSCMNGIRTVNISDPGIYMLKVARGENPVKNREVLDTKTIEFEKKFLLLRTSSGIPSEMMPDGIPEDLFEIKQGRAVLTPKGMMVSNEIFLKL
jgi:oxygen-independent coproporphyrinogen-3 oxidase